MEERRWDELNADCLVEILSRVEIKLLVKHVQFVCQSWFHATDDPKCWDTLKFFTEGVGYSEKYIKYLVNRSQRSATLIGLPIDFSPDLLLYVSEKCPNLLGVVIPPDRLNSPTIYEVICKWKKLMILYIYCTKYLKEILEAVNIHCKNFSQFSCLYSYIGIEEASAIVKFIPRIKKLTISYSTLPREYLLMILKGCKDLKCLDVSECIGFEADDYEILQLSSHIKSFNCNGSKAAKLQARA